MSVLKAFNKLVEDKREFRKMMSRVERLPNEYGVVFHKMQAYMWGSGPTDGMDVLRIQYGVVELFEVGAAEGKSVLEITGEDVAAFCDSLLQGAKMHADDRRHALNRDILKEVRATKTSLK